MVFAAPGLVVCFAVASFLAFLIAVLHVVIVGRGRRGNKGGDWERISTLHGFRRCSRFLMIIYRGDKLMEHQKLSPMIWSNGNN